MDFHEILYYGVLLKYAKKMKVRLKLDKYIGHLPCFSLLAVTYIAQQYKRALTLVCTWQHF